MKMISNRNRFFSLLLNLMKAANEETERSQITTFQVRTTCIHLTLVRANEDRERGPVHYKCGNSYKAINHLNNRRDEIMGRCFVCLFVCLLVCFFFGTDVLIGAMHLWSVFRWHLFTTGLWFPSRSSYSGFCACWLPPAEALSIKMRHFLSAAPGSW